MPFARTSMGTWSGQLCVSRVRHLPRARAASAALCIPAHRCCFATADDNFRIGRTRGDYAVLAAEDVAAFRAAVDAEAGVLVADAGMGGELSELDGFNRDWFGRHRGQSRCVIRPKTTEELAAVLRHCHTRRLAVVPQGGNTGLVGGSVPVFDEVVVSTSRMNCIDKLEPLSGVVTVQAGVVLQQLEEWLAPRRLMVPLDLGARGTCQLGGNASTAAGGARFARFGSLRSNIVGLEVVTADGTVMDMLSTMRKDNTGFDLKQLFIGAEGTLGVISKLAIQCHQSFGHVNSCLVACPSFEHVLRVYTVARETLGEVLSAIEFLDRQSIDAVLKARPDLRDPLPSESGQHQFFVIVESGGAHGAHDNAKLDQFLGKVMASGDVVDGVVAQDKRQAASFWEIRDNVSVAMNTVGSSLLLYDISLPQQRYYELVEELRCRVTSQLPDAAVVGFGHLADGNLHLNVQTTTGGAEAAAQALALMEPYIFEWSAAAGGSVSAEHGLGTKRQQYLGLAKPPEVIAAMRAIKAQFDPYCILNPYKVFPD